MLLPYIFASSIKKKKKTLYPPLSHAHTENTVNFHNLSLSTFPFSLSFLSPSTTNGFCHLSRPFPDIRFYFLLSSLSPLSICLSLSVCLSVTRHFTRSLTRSVSHTVRITPIHLVHSLAHSPALAHTLVGFLFFFLFHTRWLYVCNNMDLQSRAFIVALFFLLFSLAKSINEKRCTWHFKY